MYGVCNYKRSEVNYGENSDNSSTDQSRGQTGSPKILSQLHMTMSEAIALYLNQITLHKGIPFEIKIRMR